MLFQESHSAALSAENKSLNLRVQSLHSEITTKDEELDRMSKQLMKLTEKVKKLEKENEIIPLLKTQVRQRQIVFLHAFAVVEYLLPYKD